MQEEIHSNWQFKQVSESEWMTATVPGTVHTDLLANGKIEDPFYRLNEHDQQWIDKVDWEYQTSFDVSDELLAKDRVELLFEGLDTYAEVFMNGTSVLISDNMFRQYVIDCKELLQAGENTLRIVFSSPINKGIEKYDALGFTIPVSDNDLAAIGQAEDEKQVSIFTRKAGYHFGWDWGPRLVPSGIWRPVKLVAWNALRINDLFIQQEQLGDVANMIAQFEVETEQELETATFAVKVNGLVVQEAEFGLAAGRNTIALPFEIQNPELWWPNGLGEQVLYNVEVAITSGENVALAEERIGLREIKLVMEPDSIGTSFYFTVNGHPVFMKGANYIPQDVFLPRVTKDDYTHILQSAKDANMNMLRVWGGGVYEDDLFYDMCDEMGLLVWQDFMFACAMFPGDSAFLESVRAEAIDNVKRIRNHPSIALWCGNNEILSAWENWGWKEREAEVQGKEVADVIWKAYDDIFHTILPDVVAEFDGQRSYWPSSPGSEFGKKEDAELKKGDMHYWGVWWGKEPFANYETMMPRFMSEFGFQSFPELSTVEKYALPEDYDIYSDVMKSHQRSSIGNGTIKEYMDRHYRTPKDFESFLYVSHLLQAQGIGFGVEAQRRNMHKCMGSLYWQINDCWPVASWAGIDYFGKWKALHYEMKRKFSEQIISFKITDNKVDVWVVSDALANKSATLSVQVIDLEGNVLKTFNRDVDIVANSAGVYNSGMLSEWLGDKEANEVVLKGSLSIDGHVVAEQIHNLVPFKEIEFLQPNLAYELTKEGKEFVLGISTQKLAKGVFVVSKLSGNFSDNYFDLLPGETKKIRIASEGMNLDDFKAGLTVVSLIDSY